MPRVLAALCVGVGSLLPAAAQTQPTVLPLEIQGVTPLDCSPLSTLSCFRAIVGLGKLRLDISKSKALLLNNLKVRFDDAELGGPFYAVPLDVTQARGKRVALILVDVSGSMVLPMSNGLTRFQAAQAAIKAFLSDFDPAVDEVAVVPFESHHVVETIRGATFAAKLADAQRQIQNLPQPKSNYNTALYSAVSAGIDVLSARKDKNPEAEYLLVVMTDGKNDVRRGDDTGLLSEPGDMIAVGDKVLRSGIATFGIGLGNDSDVDLQALEAIANRNSSRVEDAEELSRVLHVARQQLTSRLQVTFEYPQSMNHLAGKNHEISVTLMTGSAKLVGRQTWKAPVFMPPQAMEKCDAEEQKALMNLAAGKDSSGSPWLDILLPVLVFVGLGCVLLMFWFLVSRLIWPDSYTEELPPVEGGRWAAGRQTIFTGRPGGAPPTVNSRPLSDSGTVKVRPPGDRRASDETYIPGKQYDARTRIQ